MNSITEKLTSSVEPRMAIIVFEGYGDFYLERRDIVNGRMTAGVPLTEECLSDVSEVISATSERTVHGFIPPFMLYADCRPGNEKYVWYRKPEKRMLFFSQNLNIPSGEMKVPGLIYMVERTTLSIFAIKTKRVSLKTKLYHAPFFNVYDSASVCLGNAKVKKPGNLTYESVIKYWEDKFWLSRFDHLLGNNPVNGNLSTITKLCIETGCDFPLDELKPTNQTLNSLLK